MMRVKFALRAQGVVLAYCVALGGCADKTETSIIASATAAIAKRDFASATVLLKDLLATNPNSAEARLLLGRAAFEAGDFVSADLELRKARELKLPAPQWAPLLSSTMLQRGQFKPLLSEFAGMLINDPLAQADVRATVASALAATGDSEQAQQLIAANLSGQPQHAATLLLKARLLAQPGTLQESIDLVEGLTQREVKNVDAWRLLGDLQFFGRQDAAKATQAYDKVLALRPNDVPAHSNLILINLASKDLVAAKSRLVAMERALPGHPQARFMAARVAFLVGEPLRARELTQQLLRLAPNNTTLLEFAGAVELQLKSPAQAESYLRKALAQAPVLPAARRLLADIYLRAGGPAKALEVLRPNLELGTPDAVSLSLAGEAYLVAGDPQRAATLYERASKAAPDELKYKTALALVMLSKGQVEAAFSELRSLGANAKDVLPDMTLISALMRRQQWPEALTAIAALEKKQPDKPIAANLRGNVYLMQRNLPQARASFDAALTRDPLYMPAVASLAIMDLAESRPKQAEERYAAVIKSDPKNSTALLALAQLKLKSGGPPDEATKLIDQAVQANPSEVGARLAQIIQWIDRRDIKSALTAAQAAKAALPDNTEVLDALGSVQLLAGDANQAISSFNKVAAALPNAVKPQLRLADAYLQTQNFDAAANSFKRALDLSPADLPAQKGLIALSVRDKKIGPALEVARTIQKQRANDAIGFVLEGDLHAEFKSYDAALKAYRDGTARPVSGRAAERLHALLLKVKGRQEADAFAQDWIKRHPNDHEFVLTLGSRALVSQEYALADRYFSDLAKAMPRSAEVLNNLAWLRAKQGKPGAVAIAEAASALQPDNPAMLDTLAFAQAEDNQVAKAIDTCKAVLVRAPEEPVYRLGCAKILLRGNLKKEAKTELERLAALGGRYAGQAEVASLLKTLP